MDLRRVTLAIHGLPTDKSGALAIEQALAGTAGVARAYVNAALETAYVEYDAALIDIGQLAAAVESTGFWAGEPSFR